MTDLSEERLSEQRLSDLVAVRPAAARVLEGFGLDYCCHGNRTLSAACDEAGVDVDVVQAKLDSLGPLETEPSGDWAELEPVALIEHILTTHHAYLHEELPLLDALAAKVHNAHSTRHPELDQVRQLVAELRADLEPHLMKEERVLFPAILSSANGQHEFPFGSIGNPIHMMVIEHERAGQILAGLRKACSGYTVPADACASYTSLYQRLEALELDTHLHILEENHTLFPAALAAYDS